MTNSYNTIFGEEIIDTKFCKSCKNDLPIIEFRKRGEGENKNRFYTICLQCEKVNQKKLRSLKKTHGRMKKQFGTCECCGNKEVTLHFDHCHETNVFRGNICEACNTAIGRMGDNLNGALNILRYMVEKDLVSKRKDTDPVYDMMLKTTNAFIFVARDLIKKIENG